MMERVFTCLLQRGDVVFMEEGALSFRFAFLARVRQTQVTVTAIQRTKLRIANCVNRYNPLKYYYPISIMPVG